MSYGQAQHEGPGIHMPGNKGRRELQHLLNAKYHARQDASSDHVSLCDDSPYDTSQDFTLTITFPKWPPLYRYFKASFAFRKSKVLSKAGLMPCFA